MSKRIIPALLSTLLAGPVLAQTPITVYADGAALTRDCDQALAALDQQAESIRKLPLESANVTRVFPVWNRMRIAFEDRLGPIYLQTYVHPNAKVREAGEACILRANNAETALFQDPALFERVQAVQPEDAIDSQLQEDLLDSFRDSGASLPPEPRTRARDILDQIETLSQRFQRNLRENDATLRFSKDEQTGLPTSYLERVDRADNGDIVVGFDYPDYFPFMAHADSEAARQRYYRAFVNRGGQVNIEILSELSQLRRQLAGLYGLPSYATLATRSRMVENPGTVTRFLDRVNKVIQTLAADQVATLQAHKATHLNQESAVLKPWDKNYYLERLRQQRFDIDQEELRRYFPMPEMTHWVLGLAADLYGLAFEETKTAVWHEDVRHYTVSDRDSGTFLGSLYLDLYPRPGKYGHAAAFGLRGASALEDRRPASALVTNFDRNGLTQQELETFLHEIGHALHGVLSTTRYVMHSGTDVALDFVEAPSQMFEEWGRRPETLNRIQAVCEDCPTIDTDLIARLDAARRLDRPLVYSRQWLYAAYDMALAGPEPLQPLPAWAQLAATTALGHVPGTEFPGTFSHIAGGYAAGYYGYMWSEALALDMLSAFGDNLMNKAVGARFRKQVLARGGELPAARLVQTFLERETRPDAFFAEIRGARGRQE